MANWSGLSWLKFIGRPGVGLVCAACAAAGSATPQPIAAPLNPIPLYAYYYIWFDVPSWDRAKTDYPLLGRYSSDDAAVMRQHIQWAKSAGIEGFIVSWKSTEKLDRRLAQLAQIAEAENFKLAIIYQGLDFERDPLPAERIAADLDYFIAHYQDHPAFNQYPRPIVIWSGTWEFSQSDIANVTEDRRAQLLILASEKNLAGYQRLADWVDGNAYYWSSVNPDTNPTYATKLAEMSVAVHEQQGLWIAPAAPGFDARLVGGTTVVERKDGDTLRVEMNVALQSTPDLIGLISWNEFSENSHIEPSEKFGDRYLTVLADLRAAPAPAVGEFDSSAPEGAVVGLTLDRLLALGAVTFLIAAGLVVTAWRSRS